MALAKTNKPSDQLLTLTSEINDQEGIVLIFDPQKCMYRDTGKSLESRGIQVRNVREEKSTLEVISPRWLGILMINMEAPGGDGLELLDKVRRIDEELPVLMVLDREDISLVVSAMRMGAYDVIKKTFSCQNISKIILSAFEKRRLTLENRRHQSAMMRRKKYVSFIQRRSSHMEKLFENVQRIGETDADVLIVGEMGTGKKMVARCLHDQSPREHKIFITVDCSESHEETFAGDLFGRGPGGFPGIQHGITGKIECAKGGTIFFDKIDRLSTSLQDRLLKCIREGAFNRSEPNELTPLDIRVIASTQRDLKKACEAGTFCEELFFRLNAVSMVLPPLREHREDIPLLFQHFVHQACSRYQRPTPLITSEIYQELLMQDWPGNFHELKNAAERWTLGFKHDLPSLAHPPENNNLGAQVLVDEQPLAEKINAFEKTLLTTELTRTKGQVKTGYLTLGLPRKTFYDKMNKHGLRRKDFVEPPSFSNDPRMHE